MSDKSNPKVTGARGGRARAASMSAEELSRAARAAAKARWGGPREIKDGVLEIVPGYPLACAVLDTEQRVLSTRGMSRAFGYQKTGTNNTRTGAPQPPPFLASGAIKPFLSDDLIVLLNSPIVYRPKIGGRTAYGYDCTVFPKICKAVIAADEAGALRSAKAGAVARAMIDALVGVAMVALVDEATGYQADRARDELQQILKAYVAAEMLPWLKRFPASFFEETYRLMGWEYKPGTASHPQFIGKVINECIYKRLPAPVLPKLRELNPIGDRNRRRHKHHQYLTEETGIPHLDRQITAVVTLMRAAQDRRQFQELLVRAFPVSGDQMPLGTAT